MKKRFVSIVLATMVGASAMAGCGNVSSAPTEDGKGETQLYVENETDEAVIEEPDKTFKDIAEQEQLDSDIVQKIADQFDPVTIAAEEYWTDVLDMSKGYKDLVREMNQKIAAKATVKLVDINLNDSTVTYKVTAPDVISFMDENMSQASSLEELADVLSKALDRDDIPVKERELTIPIEISGSEVSLNFNSKEVMDSITGGFYGTIEATK